MLTSFSNSSSTTESSQVTDVDLNTIPMYVIAYYLFYICCPFIILFGTFGNVMTIVIMRRMTSGDSCINLYLTGMAIMDLVFIFSTCLPEWIRHVSGYYVYVVNNVVCKVLIWINTCSGTISCWFLVSMTLHRAMSVVWPHRVNLLCTRRTVLILLLGIGAFLTGLYSHYAYGMDLVSTDGGKTHNCLMQSGGYMDFVFSVFIYLELTVYSLLPFVCLVLGNGVLIWRLSASVKDARNRLSQGNTEQVLSREKAANSVTLTVTVVSVTFILLTLPISINYILSYFAREYNEVTGYDYAKNYLFYIVSYLLAYSNSAVNFYLYCLTGRRFREEFVKVMNCGKLKQGRDSSQVKGNVSGQSTHHSRLSTDSVNTKQDLKLNTVVGISGN